MTYQLSQSICGKFSLLFEFLRKLFNGPTVGAGDYPAGIELAAVAIDEDFQLALKIK
jgi:hypothetical protein